ncbi:bb877c76-bf64-4c72-a50a-0c9a480a0e4d [Thermothielavioides terrestris]|uniref:Bb877c76-bf64-4c72-a50a-0c9a480a0e4d n=1 Tax=Thermothielavioides terrestris TaxID=2587410 RepID=A0A3S4CYM7_9PEZI|nr:bb877c76-bf64-4c72-a50a-0c9a480a0e4d [Thermothielavioides terrestris]
MTSLETKLAPAEAEDDIRSQTLQGNTGEADGEKHESHKEGDAEAQHPSTTGLVLIAAGLCLSVFLVSLDQTIVSNAIPKITDEFGSTGDIGWYGSAAFQLFYGKAYSFFSIKIIFMLAIGLFELGSLVCALAPTSPALIVGRAIAGLGAAGIMPGAIIIISHSVPLRRRPIFLGSMGGMFGIASVCGPLLGGVFTDRLTWRWCFYINLPFGGFAALTILLFFKPPDRPVLAQMSILDRVKKIDWLGLLVFIPSIVSLLLALQWGGVTYPWKNGRIIGLFVVFGVTAIAFGIVQFWRKDDAIIPPRIITQRSVAAGVWYALFNAAGFMIVVYYTPIWHQVIGHVSAVDSGVRLLPVLIGLVITVMLSGALVSVFGYYTPFMILASILAPIGEGLMYTWTVDTTFGQWFGYEALTGLAVGMGMQQPLVAVQTVLPIDDVPVATSAVAFAQTLGGAIFIAIAQVVFQNVLIANLPAGNYDRSGLLTAGVTDIITKVPPQLLPSILVAFNEALTHVYIVSICMSALTIVGSLAMEWRSVKKKTSSGASKEPAGGQA